MRIHEQSMASLTVTLFSHLMMLDQAPRLCASMRRNDEESSSSEEESILEFSSPDLSPSAEEIIDYGYGPTVEEDDEESVDYGYNDWSGPIKSKSGAATASTTASIESSASQTSVKRRSSITWSDGTTRLSVRRGSLSALEASSVDASSPVQQPARRTPQRRSSISVMQRGDGIMFVPDENEPIALKAKRSQRRSSMSAFECASRRRWQTSSKMVAPETCSSLGGHASRRKSFDTPCRQPRRSMNSDKLESSRSTMTLEQAFQQDVLQRRQSLDKPCRQPRRASIAALPTGHTPILDQSSITSSRRGSLTGADKEKLMQMAADLLALARSIPDDLSDEQRSAATSRMIMSDVSPRKPSRRTAPSRSRSLLVIDGSDLMNASLNLDRWSSNSPKSSNSGRKVLSATSA